MSKERLAKPLTIAGAILAVGTLDYGSGVLADANYGSNRAKAYLEDSGYTNPILKDVDKLMTGFNGCDRTDNVVYEFKAKGLNGKETNVKVCKGVFKGATIRQG